MMPYTRSTSIVNECPENHKMMSSKTRMATKSKYAALDKKITPARMLIKSPKMMMAGEDPLFDIQDHMM